MSRLTLLTMAVHAFDEEHHQHPSTLAELTPKYLSSIPVDPFAISGRLKYLRNGEDYALYSVGPDGVDDGGKPIFDSAHADKRYKHSGYQVNIDSKGDIVAGKN